MKTFLTLLLLTASASVLATPADTMREFGLVGHFGVTCHDTPDESYINFMYRGDVATIEAGASDKEPNVYKVNVASIVGSIITFRVTLIDNTIRVITIQKQDTGFIQTMDVWDGEGHSLVHEGKLTGFPYTSLPAVQPCFSAI